MASAAGLMSAAGRRLSTNGARNGATTRPPLQAGRHIGGEVAGHHRRRRNESRGVERNLTRGRSLVAGEEEDPVSADRAADRPAELVALQAVLLVREEVRGAEAAVAVELEERPVEHVGARARDRADRRAGAQPARGLLGAGREAELLQRVGKGQMQTGAVVHVAVGRAVQRVGDAEVVAARPPRFGARCSCRSRARLRSRRRHLTG